ncbi:MAG: hypothetical protein AAF611_21025 [Bacteroidota bacterium]
MDLQSRKIKFVQEFLKIQSEEVLSQLEHILKIDHSELPEATMKPFTIEEFNSRINQSLEDSKNGEIIEDTTLKSMIDTWK